MAKKVLSTNYTYIGQIKRERNLNERVIIFKKRVFGIDIIKGVAILLVVSLHSGLWRTDFWPSNSFGRIIQYSFRLLAEGVPIFVMVHGFFTAGIIRIGRRETRQKVKKTTINALFVDGDNDNCWFTYRRRTINTKELPELLFCYSIRIQIH